MSGCRLKGEVRIRISYRRAARHGGTLLGRNEIEVRSSYGPVKLIRRLVCNGEFSTLCVGSRPSLFSALTEVWSVYTIDFRLLDQRSGDIRRPSRLSSTFSGRISERMSRERTPSSDECKVLQRPLFRSRTRDSPGACVHRGGLLRTSKSTSPADQPCNSTVIIVRDSIVPRCSRTRGFESVRGDELPEDHFQRIVI